MAWADLVTTCVNVALRERCGKHDNNTLAVREMCEKTRKCNVDHMNPFAVVYYLNRDSFE